MALTAIRFLCVTALLVFPALGGRSRDHSGEVHSVPVSANVTVNVTTINKSANMAASYIVSAPKGMPIFGVLNQLQASNRGFNFTYSISNSYGIFLESVNGVAGSTANKTYWQLLSKKGKSVTPLTVGIGCYQPENNGNFIMNFTTWA